MSNDTQIDKDASDSAQDSLFRVVVHLRNGEAIKVKAGEFNGSEDTEEAARALVSLISNAMKPESEVSVITAPFATIRVSEIAAAEIERVYVWRTSLGLANLAAKRVIGS